MNLNSVKLTSVPSSTGNVKISVAAPQWTVAWSGGHYLLIVAD